MNQLKRVHQVGALALIGVLVFCGETLTTTPVHATANPVLSGPEGRVSDGGSYWSSSNLREWLNANTQTVTYTNNAPTNALTANMGYDTEAGFLAAFTTEEQSQIAITKHRTYVQSKDAVAQEGKGGTTPHANNYGPVYLGNYPEFALTYQSYGYKADEDKVFLLTPTEAYWYLTRRGYTYGKTATPEAAKKHNKSTTTWNNWWFSGGTEHKLRDYAYYANTSSLMSTTTAYNNKLGVVPALHLKPTATLSNGKQASELAIGDIVTLGTYLGAKIEWQVINKTDDDYPLLLAVHVLDFKVLDAKGDGAKQFSESINWNASADVSILADLQYHSTSGLSDTDVPLLTIRDSSPLSVRQNGPFSLTLDFKDEGDSGFAWALLPNGQKVTNTSVTYTFSANGSHVFKLMDNAGNYNEHLIAISNVNADPSIMMTSSNSDWTNQNVNIDIKANTDVKQTASPFNITGGSGYSGSLFPNYASYANATFRVSGTVKLVSYDDRAKNSVLNLGFNFQSATNTKYTQKLSGSWTSPQKMSVNTLIEEGEIPFEFTYTVPSNYFQYLRPYIESTLSTLYSDALRLTLTDITYELLDNSGFAVSSITLPDNTVLNQSSHSETITQEGSNQWFYKVSDNRGKITVRSLTTKIDKTKPTLTITGNTSTWSTKKELTAKTSDALSGVLSLTLPNNQALNTTEAPYVVTQNGSYVFKSVDKAGNSTTVTQVVSSIDTTGPSFTTQWSASSWTNQDVTLTVTASDTQSGLAPAPYSFDGGKTWQSGNSKTFSSNQDVLVMVRDALGTTSQQTLSLGVIDKTLPLITKYEGVPENWNEDANLQLFASDGESGLHDVAYSFDGGATWQASHEKTFSTATTVEAVVRDKAGNRSVPLSISMGMIDKVPPSLIIDPVSERLNAEPVLITVTFQDFESGIASYTLPDGKVGYPVDKHARLTLTYEATANGEHLFSVIDLAGHISTQSVSIHQVVTDALTDSPTQIDYKLESFSGELIQDWTVLEKGKSLSFVGERNQQITARITDEVGKTSQETAWLRIDKTLPIIHYSVTKEYGSELRAVVDLDVIEAGGSGLQALEYSLNNGLSWLPITGSQFTVLGSPSQSTLDVLIRATDVAGNKGVTALQIAFDVTGPTVTLLGDGTTTWTNQSLTITAIVSDESGIKGYTLPDGTTVNVADTPKTLTISYQAEAIGHYAFTFADAVGNQTETSIFMDLIDKTNPNVSITNSSGGNWTTDSVQLQLNGSN